MDRYTDLNTGSAASVAVLQASMNTRIAGGYLPVSPPTVDGSSNIYIVLGKPTHRSRNTRRFHSCVLLASAAADVQTDITAAVTGRDHFIYSSQYNATLAKVLTLVLIA